jgi:hypothetical protein
LITLLTPPPDMPDEPDAKGTPYTQPGAPYVGVPLGLWRNGWILDLPATSLVMLLVVLDVQRGGDKPSYLPTGERSEYGLSDDTWTRGCADLNKRGLLEISRIPQGGDFDYTRLRNVYRVRTEAFDQIAPGIPAVAWTPEGSPPEVSPAPNSRSTRLSASAQRPVRPSSLL